MRGYPILPYALLILLLLKVFAIYVFDPIDAGLPR